MTENYIDNSIAINHGLLPNFCDVRVVFILILLTELLALVLAMAIPSGSTPFWNYLALTSLLMQWIALVNAALLCPLRFRLNHLADKLAIPLSFMLMSAVSFIISFISVELDHHLFFDTLFASSQHLDKPFIMRVMVISMAIYAVVLRYFYIQRQWRINIAAQAQAEVVALRARIRPHFLFNSMNTIASLIAVAPDTAETAIEDLADLFRASLSEHNLNTVEDEIELTKSYLNIEKLRLGDRLQVQWNIDKSLNNILIPSLLLQPLAENAVYHGIEPLTRGGKIGISTLKLDEHLLISVRNPVATDSAQQCRKGNQMAQQNIKQRLALVYANRAAFITNDTKDDYIVTLKIPLNPVST